MKKVITTMALAIVFTLLNGLSFTANAQGKKSSSPAKTEQKRTSYAFEFQQMSADEVAVIAQMEPLRTQKALGLITDAYELDFDWVRNYRQLKKLAITAGLPVMFPGDDHPAVMVYRKPVDRCRVIQDIKKLAQLSVPDKTAQVKLGTGWFEKAGMQDQVTEECFPAMRERIAGQTAQN